MQGLWTLLVWLGGDVVGGIHSKKGWGNSNYGMSKLALIAVTKIWACEEARNGIQVNCCCPGYCDTDMTSHNINTSTRWNTRELAWTNWRFWGRNQCRKCTWYITRLFSRFQTRNVTWMLRWFTDTYCMIVYVSVV